MKKALDIFSRQADTYKKFRPTYPRELFDEILKFVPNRTACWDCATGNGQVAMVLAEYFDKVYATDISEQQLKAAYKSPKIVYKLERAEKTGFMDNQFDLITVGQAMHWFDMEAFNKEVLRVARNGGIIAVWGYGLLRIGEEIDKHLDKFYYQVVGRYWNAERKHVDERYSKLNFGFDEINELKSMDIKTAWNLDQLEGYLTSWSSVQHFIDQNKGLNPVPVLIDDIRPLWGNTPVKPVKFPIFLKIGRVSK